MKREIEEHGAPERSGSYLEEKAGAELTGPRDLEVNLRRLARDERTSPGLARTLEELLGWLKDTPPAP